MINSRSIRIVTALLSIGLILLCALPALASTVTIRLPSVQGQAGNMVDVPIQVVGAPGIGALHMELVYDPKVLTVDSVTKGSLAGNNALVDSNAATKGRLLIGVVTLDAIKGDGPVASVRFKLIGDAGSNSPLTLENGKAWEGGTHAEILVKTEPGKVTVVGGLPDWLIPALLALLALILLLLILFLLLRRRRKPAPQPAYAFSGPAPSSTAPPAPYMAPRPATGAPPPPASLPETRPSPQPQTNVEAFKKAEDQYYTLRGRLSAGRLTQAQFESELKGVMVQDAQGRYWSLGADSGKWFVYDGQKWVEGNPY